MKHELRLRTLGKSIGQSEPIPAIYKNKRTGRHSYRVDLWDADTDKHIRCIAKPHTIERARAIIAAGYDPSMDNKATKEQ